MSPWRFAAPRPRRAVGALLASLLLGLAGCHIVSVSGPTSGTVGQVLTYDVLIQHNVGVTLPDNTVWLMVEIPSAWSVAGASFAGTVDGGAVSGTPNQGAPTAADPGDCFTDSPASGYQRVFFSAGPFPQILQNDQGTLTVHLATAGSPGNFTLGFRAATESGPMGDRSLTCELEAGIPPTPPVTVTYDVSLAPSPIATPTLGTWGLALLALLLVGLGLRRLASGT